MQAHKHHPHHHEHHGQDLALAARKSLESAGEQWTAMRAAIFDVLVELDRPASAYDIADRVGQARGKRVAANSVYRILDLFVRTNLVRRIESANAYIVNSHPGCWHDCIFLVCDSCGAASHVDDDRLAQSVRATAEAQGFEDVRPVIEVRGRCAACH